MKITKLSILDQILVQPACGFNGNRVSTAEMNIFSLFWLKHSSTAREVSAATQKRWYPVWAVCKVRNPTLHLANFAFWSAVSPRLPTRPDRLLTSVFLLDTLLVPTFATKKNASESVASSRRNVGLQTAPYRPRSVVTPHVTESRRRGWSIPMRVHATRPEGRGVNESRLY